MKCIYAVLRSHLLVGMGLLGGEWSLVGWQGSVMQGLWWDEPELEILGQQMRATDQPDSDAIDSVS